MPFFPSDDLADRELFLRPVRTSEGRPEQNWLPAYYFDICLPCGTAVGTCTLRIGQNESTVWGGHIAYTVEPAFRGHRYAAKACLLLFRLARRHGMREVRITCDKGNAASSRTCQLLGGTYIGSCAVPEDQLLASGGIREVMVYRFDLTSAPRTDVCPT